jgi:excisionase family DNA binding protein
MSDKLLTVKEVADTLTLKETTIYEWLKAGKLKGAKIGDTWRVKESDLQAFIESAYKIEAKE